MSACISSRGEYSFHELDELHTCTWCGVLDEEALRAELAALRTEALEVSYQLATARSEGVAEGWRQAIEAMRHQAAAYTAAGHDSLSAVYRRAADQLASLTPTTEEGR